MGSHEVILLDTHALIWMDIDDPLLGKKSRGLIAAAWTLGELAVSAMSFWECALLHSRGRLSLPQPPGVWRRELLHAGLNEWPLSGDIGILAHSLEGLHKDPADRFIAATAIFHGAALMTADERLLGWKHALKRHPASK